MLERIFLGLVSLMLLGSVGALFYFVPLVPWFVAALFLTTLVLMFALGFCIRPRNADGQIEDGKAAGFHFRFGSFEK